MYYIKKTMSVSSAHRLNLSYESKCQNIHGHNWKVTVYCKAEVLNENGMIVDFTDIKNIVNQLDHSFLNDSLKQPTAENIARYLCDTIPFCYQVDIEETEGNTAVYAKEV